MKIKLNPFEFIENKQYLFIRNQKLAKKEKNDSIMDERIQKLFNDESPLFLKRVFYKGLEKKARLVNAEAFVDTKNLKISRTDVFQYKNFIYVIYFSQNVKSLKTKIDIYKILLKKVES